MEHSGKAVSGKFPVSADSTELNSGTTRTQPEKSAILICSFFFFFLLFLQGWFVCVVFLFFFQQGTTYANNIKQNSIFSSHHYSVETEMGKGTTRPFTFPSLLNSFLRWCKAINSLQSIDSSGLHFLQGTH